LGLLSPGNRYVIGSEGFLMNAKHASIEQQLANQPGDQLVLVHYGTHHDVYEELVYNHADIDRSKIIWARSLGTDQDNDLIRHYPNREVWNVEEDAGITLRRAPFNPGSYSSRLAPGRSK
jgi:hypothetical protein